MHGEKTTEIMSRLPSLSLLCYFLAKRTWAAKSSWSQYGGILGTTYSQSIDLAITKLRPLKLWMKISISLFSITLSNCMKSLAHSVKWNASNTQWKRKKILFITLWEGNLYPLFLKNKFNDEVSIYILTSPIHTFYDQDIKCYA